MDENKHCVILMNMYYFLNSKIFYVFLRTLFCSPSLYLFDPKYSKGSNIVKYFYYLKNWFLFEF